MAGLYNLKNVWNKSPIQLTVSVIAVVNFANIMNWLTMTGDQISGLNMALVAVLGLFIADKTSNDAVLQEMADSQVVTNLTTFHTLSTAPSTDETVEIAEDDHVLPHSG